MKLYTRTGDDGSSALFGGARVRKDHLRLEAYGTLDEVNSFLGLCRLHGTPSVVPATTWNQIQSDLFVISAHLATPLDQIDRLATLLHTPLWDLEAMEADIDRLTALAPPLQAFVLPGGGAAASYGHVARTVCRRAERLVVSLATQEPIPELALTYLNRLSDWLFAYARAENAQNGLQDTAWNT